MSEASTDDPRYIVIDGRRWRASDPDIPERLRTELVSELMAARREVGAAGRADDDARVAAARGRVQDAKVALGERGAKWWTDVSDADASARLAASMRALLRHRAPESSICPSDAARVAGGAQWRDRMTLARQVAFDLQEAGVTQVLQRGEPVTSQPVTGPLRIARGPHFSDA